MSGTKTTGNCRGQQTLTVTLRNVREGTRMLTCSTSYPIMSSCIDQHRSMNISGSSCYMPQCGGDNCEGTHNIEAVCRD